MYAIIQTGGKQYRVEKGQTVDIEKILGEVGSPVKFDQVLLIADGDNVRVGRPNVPQGVVMGELIGSAKGPKIDSMKYEKRSNYQKHWGHRQQYSRVKITDISG